MDRLHGLLTTRTTGAVFQRSGNAVPFIFLSDQEPEMSLVSSRLQRLELEQTLVCSTLLPLERPHKVLGGMPWSGENRYYCQRESMISWSEESERVSLVTLKSFELQLQCFLIRFSGFLHILDLVSSLLRSWKGRFQGYEGFLGGLAVGHLHCCWGAKKSVCSGNWKEE